jgi:hypothetical protein
MISLPRVGSIEVARTCPDAMSNQGDWFYPDSPEDAAWFAVEHAAWFAWPEKSTMIAETTRIIGSRDG